MHSAILVLFACVSLAAAFPANPLSTVLEASTFTNVGVPTTLGAARVIILLFIQNFIVPIALLVLRQITLPYRILKFVQYLPVRGARFIVQLPLRIIKLPLNIVLAPLTALLFLARIAKRIVINPFSRVYNFLTSVIAFAFGVPVKVFGRIYTH